MKQLVFDGSQYVFRGDDKPMPVPQPGDMPKISQRVRTVKREYMALVKPIRAAGNGYRPGVLLDLAHDQCRFTTHGRTMCGAKVARAGGSWCARHRQIVQPSAKHFMEAAE